MEDLMSFEKEHMFLLESLVYHSRQETQPNSFQYPVLNIIFDVTREAELQQKLKTRFGSLLSFKASDYLSISKNSSLSLSEEIHQFVKSRFQYEAETVYLQTLPRMWGYVFNPVSFWYFFRSEKMEAVLCEVNNTFGEKHYYWLYQQGQDLNREKLKAQKEFHVSPFFDVQGIYEFCFVLDKQRILSQIKLLHPDGKLRLNTWIKGQRIPIENLTRGQLLIRYGWMTPLVVLRIHYQALKLWFKKVKFYTKPQRPQNEVTTNNNRTKNSEE